jgi:hypothetical protein
MQNTNSGGKAMTRSFSMIVMVTLIALPLVGCMRAPTPSSLVEPLPTGTMLFCAYGGVGTVPDPLPPGYETDFATVAFKLNNPGEAIERVRVLGAALLDAEGETTASFCRVDHFVVLPPLESPGPSLGIFAVYLNPEGTPFSGILPAGATQLRVRFSLDRGPTEIPTRCRLELGGFRSSHLVIEGKVNGRWPT